MCSNTHHNGKTMKTDDISVYCLFIQTKQRVIILCHNVKEHFLFVYTYTFIYILFFYKSCWLFKKQVPKFFYWIVLNVLIKNMLKINKYTIFCCKYCLWKLIVEKLPRTRYLVLKIRPFLDPEEGTARRDDSCSFEYYCIRVSLQLRAFCVFVHHDYHECDGDGCKRRRNILIFYYYFLNTILNMKLLCLHFTLINVFY